VTYEEYASWARSKYPAHKAEEVIDQAQANQMLNHDTVAVLMRPPQDDCPPTVRSERGRTVITPNPKRST
jgi:hypothetical protein